MDTLVELKSIHLIGTSNTADEDRVRCLEINGLKDSDSALSLTYGKRILPFTHSRPRRNGVRVDSDEVDEFFTSPPAATTALGIQTYTTTRSSTKLSSADMKLIDPVGGLSTGMFSNSTLGSKLDDGDDDDDDDTFDTPDTLVGMSVKIGVASVYVTKEALDVYDWYMYPTEEMMQSMSEEVCFSLSLSLSTVYTSTT